MKATYLHLTLKSLEVVIYYLKHDNNNNPTIAEKTAISILKDVISDLRKWESEAGE